MKTIELILSIALLAGTAVTSRARGGNSADGGRQEPAGDTVILATYQEDEYLVRRYVVNRPNDRVSDYSVRYNINMATLQKNLDDNSEALTALGDFIDRMTTESNAKVSAITITGYASPDGPYSLNERLSNGRAQDFLKYVNAKYDLSSRYRVTAEGVAEDWESCRALVASARNMPDRDAVLRIIDSSASPDAKEQQLKKMPAAWNYMKKNILPPLRRVEIVIDYGIGSIVEERILIQPIAEVETVEEEILPRRCSECGSYNCTCNGDCICNGNGIMIEVDDALLQMVDGVTFEQIDAENFEIELP